MKRSKVCLLAAVVLSLVSAVAWADKSGIRPNVIDLPRGPGSLSGLGEQFTPDLNTGSATYGVKLDVPAGTAGFAPGFALRYDSGKGNGPLGIGWSLDVGGIQRQTDHGLPRYSDGDRFLYNGQELVPIGGGVYRLHTEGAFLRFRQSADHWEVDAPDGTVLRFGVSAAARIVGPAGTFRWALEQAVDPFGNRILYSYRADRGQLYLDQIQYNARTGGADDRISFEYEARADTLSDFRPGFAVTTALRLKRIRMFASGSQVSRYELKYEPAETLSRLRAVQRFGADDVTALPTLSLEYTDFAPDRAQVVALADAPAYSLRDGNTELIDFDGDSLPDLLHTELGNHHVVLNDGARWQPAQALPSSPSVQLSTNGVQFADLDGDGMADLVAKLSTGASDFYYFPNRGQGRWEAPVTFANNPPFSFEDASVRLIDIDGDGRVDAMQTTSSGYYYWRNNGDGTWADPISGPPVSSPALLFSDAQVKLADMNGDRLVDLVHLRAGSLEYWPNQGYGGWGPLTVVSGAPDAGADQARLQLADVDGDGLSDLLLASGTQVELWRQRGDGSFAPALVVPGLPSADPATTVVRVADMNGSGTADVVWNDPTGTTPWEFLDLSGGVRPNLLSAVDNGMGRRIALHYSSSGAMYQVARDAGAPWTTRLPIPVPVVASVTTSDGRGWSSTQQFEYRDGFYDGATRQFRGFGQATERELGDDQDPTSIHVNTFDLGRTDEALKGTVISAEIRTEGGAILQRETFRYTAHLYATGVDGRKVAGPDLDWHQTDHVEASSAPISTRETLTHDDFGNVLVRSEWGVVDGTDLLAGHDERITTTEYVNDPTQWLLGRATRVVVTDAAGARLSETRHYYDGDPFVGLPLGSLGTRGALTRSEAWRDGSTYVPTERVQRDEFGQVTATLDALGTRHEVDYDPETHRFPVAERTVLEAGRALELHATYDPGLGTVSTFTDVAGRLSRFTHDALARLTAIYRPGDPGGKPSVSFEYHYGNPLSFVVTRNRIDLGGEGVLEKRFWYDGLGRQLAAVESAEDGKTLVSGMKSFGPLGRVVRELEPVFSQGYGLPETLAGPFTAHFYDALGRRVRTVLPDGTASEIRYGPLTVEHWDAEDLDPRSPHYQTPSQEKSNGLGVVEADERLGDETVRTLYERDGLGRVLSVTDPLGLVTHYRFDGLGRTVESIHPDAGKTTFQYDALGNLLVRVDARGARVVTTYDPASRPLTERLVDAAGHDEEVVRYHYDVPSPKFPDDPYAKGFLTWVEDGAGQEHYRYDERNRLVELVRSVDGKDYALGQRYDALDRMTQVRYPDGRTLDYAYGARGLLESVGGVINRIAYDAGGLAVRSEYANGVVSTARYDLMDRLVGLDTESQGTSLQALSFGYDRVGNLLSVEDKANRVGALVQTRQYGYDDLYRITSGKSPNQSWSYAYDAAGDFTRKSDQGAYQYGKGHQVARVGDKAFGYDAAGELTSRPGAKQTYDAKGRLASVELSDGTVARLRYGYTGQRVVKEVTGPGGTHRTVYADHLFEERDGEAVDYVFAGERRVARIGGPRPSTTIEKVAMAVPPVAALLGLLGLFLTGLGGGIDRLRRKRRWPALRSLGAVAMALMMASLGCSGPPDGVDESLVIYHADQLGGVSLQTDAEGEVAAENAYSPFGEPLVQSSEAYGYTGKEYDAEAGLNDFGARAYSPALGRFLSVDPEALASPELGIGDSQALNPYAYARNTPTTHVDPNGRFANIVLGAALGVGFGAGAYLLAAAYTGKFSWKGLIGSSAAGLITGAVAGATFGASLVVQVSAGAGAGAIAGITNRAITTQSISRTLDPKAIAIDATIGAVLVPVANAGAKVAGKVAAVVARRAKSTVKNALSRALGSLANGETTSQSAIVKYDGEFAAQQILGRKPLTPGGRTIMPHAAERMVSPPTGRAAMSVEEVDQVLDTATRIKKVSPHPQGDTITIQNPSMPGKPQVAVDAATGKRVITVIKSR